MSEPGKAIFLSYASQDAEAAKRICEALRAAGVEVWFDQNELVGGDAWDQKIRKQIKECALLIPIISANTQARAEGYFRLEWRLADQRTHLMGRAKAFLLPVTIDGTSDADADVPDSFVAVQWTKAPGGEVPSAFVARVQQLLRGGTPAGGGSRPAGSTPAAPTPARRRWWPGFVAAAVVAVLAVAGWLLRPVSPSAPAASATPKSEARRLAEEAYAIVTATGQTPERIRAARTLGDRATTLDALDGEVWALSALTDLSAYEMNVEVGTNLADTIRAKVAKARGLAPASPSTRLAEAKAFICVEPTPASLEAALAILEELPADNLQAKGLIGIVRQEQGQYLEAGRALLEAGWFSDASWAYLSGEDVARAEAAAQRMVEQDPVQAALHLAMAALAREDLDGMQAALARVPVAARLDESVLSVEIWLHYLRRDAAALERTARALPGPIIHNVYHSGTRGWWLAVALQWAGRPEAAREEAARALREVEARLVSQPEDLVLRFHKMYLLATLDRRAELARQVDALRQHELPGWTRVAYAELLLLVGDSEGALERLERELRTPGARRWISHSRARFVPVYDGLRRDPRFQRLLRETRPAAARPLDEPAVEKSVAVLAFANLSDDKANEYFSDGISEELLNVLAKIPGIKVPARTSAFSFKGREVPVAEIAKQLGVAYVVEGSVRRQGDKVRITAQLIKASDGFQVWNDTFTRDLKDIFAVQDEIAGLIAQQLQLKLAAGSVSRKSVNPEAYRLLLEGHHFWLQRTDAGLDRAEALFQQAIDLDPDFAQAHAGLAAVLMIRDWYRLVGGSPSVPAEARRARAEVDRARTLEPSLAEPHAILGVLLYNEGKFAEAEQAFQSALRLNPNYSYAHHWRSHLLLARGELGAALDGINRAIQLDPLSFITLVIGATWHSYAGRYDEALALSDRAQACGPESYVPLRAERAFILLQLGRKAEAVELSRQVARDVRGQPRWWSDSSAIHALRQAGLTSEADDYAERFLATLPADTSLRSVVTAARGRAKEALPQLARDGLPSSIVFSVLYSPVWDEVREDPRFLQIVGDLGVRSAYETARSELARLRRDMPATKQP